MALDWPSQSSDFNPIENIWRLFNVAYLLHKQRQTEAIEHKPGSERIQILAVEQD